MNKRHIARVLGWRRVESGEKVWGQSDMLAEQVKKRGPHTYWVGLDGPGDFKWMWLRDSMTDQEFITAMLFDYPHSKPCPEQLLPVLQASWPTMDGVELSGKPVPRREPREHLDAYGVPLPGAQTVAGRMTFTVLEKG